MLEFAKQLAKEAGYIAKGYYNNGVSHRFKSNLSDLVTDADIAVSDFIIEKIKEKYPTHGIISEEAKDDYNGDAEYVWVIDPIDGTRNFAKHIAVWCVMIGLVKNNEPHIGVIYDAMNDELFYAEKNKGAFCNGEKIKVGSFEDVRHCFTIFSNGEINKDSAYSVSVQKFKKYLKFYNNLMGETGHWFSSYGTMLSVCHLAAGRVDVLLNNSGLFHDYLAGYVIATEAGAVWTDCEGEKWGKGKSDVVVANPKLHPKLLKLFE